jgi:hypothetical protein
LNACLNTNTFSPKCGHIAKSIFACGKIDMNVAICYKLLQIWSEGIFSYLFCGSKPFLLNLEEERNYNKVASGVGKVFGR